MCRSSMRSWDALIMRSTKDEEECEEAEQFFLIKEAVEEIERMKAEVLRIQGSAECPKCGAKMPEGAVYCSNCGTKMDDMYEEE